MHHNAPKIEEIIFTRGTTESLNLVVSSFCDEFMSEGDEVIISTMEHHSNIVPWQLQAAKKGIAIRVIPINDKGEINLDEFTHLFTDRTKIVSIAQVSNVLGTVNPVKEMIKIAHEHDVPVIVDGAQSTPHFAVDVQDLDCDFFATLHLEYDDLVTLYKRIYNFTYNFSTFYGRCTYLY